MINQQRRSIKKRVNLSQKNQRVMSLKKSRIRSRKQKQLLNPCKTYSRRSKCFRLRIGHHRLTSRPLCKLQNQQVSQRCLSSGTQSRTYGMGKASHQLFRARSNTSVISQSSHHSSPKSNRWDWSRSIRLSYSKRIMNESRKSLQYKRWAPTSMNSDKV